MKRAPFRPGARLRRSGLTLALAFAAAGSGCLGSWGGLDDRPSGSAPLGEFELASEKLGRVVISPGACAAGDRQSFLGADFADAGSGFVVRLAIDPIEGPAVRVFSSAAPFDKSAVFRRADCRTFHFTDDTTAWRINDVQDYRLSLELDCTNRAGDRLSGKASANHCH